MNLSLFAVYSNGELDLGASSEKFMAALIMHETNTRADLNSVKNAIIAVFDKYKCNINTPALKGFVCAEMKATPDTFALISERVDTVLDTCPTEFKVSKGRNGGVSRIPATVPAVNS